jgi:iron complex outermembrane recepter protein
MAQTVAPAPEASSNGLEEIVVTAERRAETLQKAALSIEVVGEAQLKSLGVTRVDDLTTVVPGVQIGGGSTPLIYVRGVGDFGVVATANPAVVTSFDGVAIARPQAIAGNFFDLERVELLKGPQGTLYGRNASGGALNLLPVQPKLDGQISGYLEGELGNYDLRSAEGAINFPLGNTTAARVAFQATDRHGYLSDGTDDDIHQSFRAEALTEFNDVFRIRYGGTYTHLGGVGSGYAPVPRIPGQSAFVGSASPIAADYFLGVAAAEFAASGGATAPPAILARPDETRLRQDIRSWALDAQADYNFGPATLTVIPAFRSTRSDFAIQPTFLYSPGGESPSTGETSDQSSLEVRLGNTEGALKWVTGLYAFDERQSTNFIVDSGLIQYIHVASDLNTHAYAAFGQVTFSLTDQFRLTGGLRYTSDQRSQDNFTKLAVAPSLACSAPPGSQCDLLGGVGAGAYNSAETFNKATWKVGFEYDVAPANMVFANVSTGFKAGGFNQAVDPVRTNETLAFNPETITAYTVGSRNRFFNDRLQLNLEGFYWDYKDLQLSALILDGSGQVALATQNAGRARTAGINTELVAQPWTGATVHAAVEYDSSKYKEFSFIQAAAFTNPSATGCRINPSNLAPGPAGPYVSIDCAGFSLVRDPKWSADYGIDQLFGLPDGGNITGAVNAAYASGRWLTTDFVPNGYAPSYWTVGGSLTYNSPKDKWYASLFGRNLNNASIYTSGTESPFVAGYVVSSIGAPRTFGVRAGIHF